MIHNNLDDGLSTLISETLCHAVTCSVINQIKDGIWSMNLMSTATTSLNSDAKGIDTAGRNGGQRKRLQVSHFSNTEVTNSSIFLSATPDFLIKFN